MIQPLGFSWTSQDANKGNSHWRQDAGPSTQKWILFYYESFLLVTVPLLVQHSLKSYSEWLYRADEDFQTLNRWTSFHSRTFLKPCVSFILCHVKVGPCSVSCIIQLILFRLDVHSLFTVLKDFIKTLWKQFTSSIHSDFFFWSRLFSSHSCDARGGALLLRGWRLVLSRNNYILLYTIQLFSAFRNTCPRPRLSPPLHPQTISQLVTCIATYHHPG